MLALTRKKGESLVINNDIEITILEIRGDQIKLGVSAPPLSVFCISLPPTRLSESLRFTARYALETSLS